MKRRKMHEWGLLMVGLIMSSQIGSGFAGREWPQAKTNKQQQQQQQIYQRQQNVASEYRSLQQLQVVNLVCQQCHLVICCMVKVMPTTTDYGHTKAKSQNLGRPNSNPTPKCIFGSWI